MQGPRVPGHRVHTQPVRPPKWLYVLFLNEMFVIGIIEVLNFNYISIDRNFVSRLLKQKFSNIYVVTSLSDFIKTFHICNNPANAVGYKRHWVMVIQMEEDHRKTHELLDKTRAINMLPTFLIPPRSPYCWGGRFIGRLSVSRTFSPPRPSWTIPRSTYPWPRPRTVGREWADCKILERLIRNEEEKII